MIKKGGKVPTWVSNQPDGLSTVLEVLPYAGPFFDSYNVTLRVTAPRLRKGYTYLSFNDQDKRS